MYFEQFYLTCLAHASYLIGSEGEAAVVDPQRDVDIYLTAANEQNLKIRHIFETHLHADFVSGHKELAARTGAKIYIGAQAHAEFPHVPLTDGLEVKMGAVRLRALETPGHTPCEGHGAAIHSGERGQWRSSAAVGWQPCPLYGFGWFLNPYRGHRRYAHYGETVGFWTAIQRFPDDGLTVIVLANRAEVDAPALAESVADLYFPKR